MTTENEEAAILQGGCHCTDIRFIFERHDAMITRRTFLQAGTTSVFALPFLSLVSPDAASAAPAVKHSGLLFDPSDIHRIRKTASHPRFAPLWDSYLKADLAADNKFLDEELRLDNHVLHLNKARTMLERSSFVYAITKDPAHLDTAKRAINKILQYKKWDYFMEGGKHTIGLQRASELCVAMSFASDWMRDGLDAATIAEIDRQIGEKGAPACYLTLFGMKYPDRVRGWGFDPESDYKFRFDLSRWPIILNATNLKVIPISGLGIAACHLRGKHPQAEQWLDMARSSARAFAPMFHSDGSYDEGVGYWGYTAMYLTMFLEVLYRTTGIDDRSLINYRGTTRYGLQMSMPTNHEPADAVNFSDAHGMGDVSVAGWVAQQYRDPIAQYVATKISKPSHYTGFIWFDPALKAKQPGRELMDVRFDNDIVVSRSGWDPAGSVLAFRSGPPANHEHADRNSMIFTAYGERLLHDHFNAGYSYTVPLWKLRQTEAHTAVLIDGKGHQYHDGKEGTNASWAFAKILSYEASPKHMMLSSDATDAYQLVNDDVERVVRSVFFLKPDVFIIVDQVAMKSSTPKVQARFQVFNDDKNGKVSAEKEQFRIDRPGVSLTGRVYAKQEIAVRTGTLDIPSDLGIYPFAEAESPQARMHELVTVCTAQKGDAPHGALDVSRKGTLWTIRGKHEGTAVDVTIETSGAVPVFHSAV